MRRFSARHAGKIVRIWDTNFLYSLFQERIGSMSIPEETQFAIMIYRGLRLNYESIIGLMMT